MSAQRKLKKEDRIKENLEEMYLTPSQVEELRELGVEFEDSKVVWKISDNHQNIEIRNSIGDWVSNLGAMKWETINAPSLQEVLDKLPKFFIVDGRKFWIVIAFTNKNECSIGYEYMQYQQQNEYFIIGLKHYHNAKPLLAAFELLKWVATHHPESLTDKTE